MKIDGRCHCGAISYVAEIDPARVSICHCTDCQTLSGTAFRTAVPASRENFKLLTGEPKIYVKTTDTGARRAQAFCDTCGSPIYAADVSDSQVFMIRIGTSRQRAELVPRKQIWCRSALGWFGAMETMEKDDQQQF